MASRSMIAAFGLIATAAPAGALPPPWPSPMPAPREAFEWPRPIPDQPFAAALTPQPVPLPLRQCGIGDCLRALPVDPAPRNAPAPGFVELFATSPFSEPLDHRYAAALAAVAAITMLLWRNRGRRNTGF